MFMMRFILIALAGLLFAAQPVLAEETATQPDQGGSAAGVSETGQGQEIAVPSGGMAMEGPGMMGGPGMMMGEQGAAGSSQGMPMQPGMMGPGNPGCRMGGMKGMMPGAMMGKGCRTGCCTDCSGISRKQYRELMGRLDVLDARMAKIDAMLERLLER